MYRSLSLEEARESVARVHAEFGIDCDVETFETVFFLIDHLRSQGYVSTKPQGQIGKIIYDTAFEWYSFFHGLLVPNPQSMLMVRESDALSDELKARITSHMDMLARYHRMGQYANMTHDDELLARAVRQIVALRLGTLSELFGDIQNTIDRAWASPRMEERDLRSYG